MNTKKKTYIFLIGFIILNIVLIVVFIYPIALSIKELSANLVSQKEEISFLESKVEAFKEIEIKFENIKPDLDRMDVLFINTDLPLDFIDFLEETAIDSGVLMEIFSSSSSSKSKVDFWSSVLFQINYTGSFAECSRFLEKLETSPYVIEIQNLKVRQMTKAEYSTEEASSGDFKINLILKVYGK